MSLETLKIEIKRFTEKYLQDEPEAQSDEAYRIYFGNFHLILPFGEKRISLQKYLDDIRISKSGRTPRQFFKEIDDAVRDCGIDLERLKQLQESSKYPQQRTEIFKLTEVVYVRLIEKGYQRRDLIG